MMAAAIRDTTRDYAVAPRPGRCDGALVLHRADCPEVRAQAAAGDPVATLLGCASIPDDAMLRCHCLPPASPHKPLGDAAGVI
jgi:hypothetical protein